MADPAQTPPATPPANDPNGGNNQQQVPPANDPGNNQQPPAQEFIMNQEQFNRRFAEKMGAIETELGIQPGGLKDYVAAQKAAAKKTPAPTGEALSGAELRMAKMEGLMNIGIPSKQIPVILQHFNIAGKTREEINTSIQQLIDAKLLTIDAPAAPGTQQQQQQGPPNAAQGAGNPGVPGQPPAKKIWKESEIKELRISGKLTDEIMAEIKQATLEGRVQ